MPLDKYPHSTPSLTPHEHGFAIVTNDDTDLEFVTRAIWVGGTGNVKATLAGGETVTLNSVPVGELRIRAVRVFKTGTTATNLVGLY